MKQSDFEENARSSDGAENAERAKERADKLPTENAKNKDSEIKTVDRSKLSKEEALAETNASRQGPQSP